jgi:hypothetical protein
MTPYPLTRRLGRPQGRSGRLRKISPPPPGFDPRTVQRVASRYTDCGCSLYRTIIGISEAGPWLLSSWSLRFILMPPPDNAPRRANLIFISVRSYVCSRKGRRYLGSDKTWQVAARHSASDDVWQYVSHYLRMSVYVMPILQYPALCQQSPRRRRASNRRRTLVVPTLCSADPKGSATSSRGIRGYISLMATSIVKNNRGNSFIGDVFILYDR